MSSFISRVFRIEPDEQATVAWLFLYSLALVAGACIVGRTVGVTLFLHRVDPKYLAYMYAVGAALLTVTSIIYARYAERLRGDRMVVVTMVGFAVITLLCRVGLHYFGTSIILLGWIYVMFEVIADIGFIQYWTLASDVFTARQAKRLFGVIAAGGTLAGIVFGALVGATVQFVGVADLL